MDSTTAIQSQSLIDLAIQNYGTPEALVSLAFDNELALTDELAPGQELNVPELDVTKTDIAAYYAKKSIWPSTAITDEVDDIINNEDPCNLCKCFT